MYEIHVAVAAALVELGLEAFAFRRRRVQHENIVIRVEYGEGVAEVWTAFVGGEDLFVGKSNLCLRKCFKLSDPKCFDNVVAFLRGNRGVWTECDVRDERFGIGDIIESWIEHTPGFHLGVGGGCEAGWL